MADLFPLTDVGAEFAVLFLLVIAGPLFARRLRLPGLVGLVLAGMVVGPNVLNIVSGQVLINALGFVGLLYLLFQGGLDLDLDGFLQRRRESVVFGVATFVLPMVAVTGVMLLLDLPLLAAFILGSALTSHTPLAFPIVARFDLLRTRGVIASLGATLIANTGALLVLAVVSAAARGQTTTLQWIGFGLGLVGYVVLMLSGVPRLTRWFFRGPGQDRDVRLTYLLSGLGFSALLAGILGIEPIVGAFLAGLAFNRFVPHGTLIADRVEVLGRSLFVPAFLISTGMMLDPLALVGDMRTLTMGVVLAAALLVSKWLAASTSGLLFGIARSERGLMFALTVGQAAGALAAAVVGEELGLITLAEVNAIILVIMVSALVAGIVAEHSSPRVQAPGLEGRSIGKRVVVPVSNPNTVRSLVRVAGEVAAPDSGAVVAVNVLPFDAEAEQVRAHRELAGQAERAALAVGAEVHTAVRIDASIDGGVLHSVVEQDGTCLVIGWDGRTGGRGGSLFGPVIDRCVDISPVPVLVCRPGIDERTGRVLVVVTDQDLSPASERGLALAFEVAARLSRHTEVPAGIVSDLPEQEIRARLEGRFQPELVLADQSVLRTIAEDTVAGDVVIAVAPMTPSRLGRGARRVADAALERTVVVTIPR